MSEIRISVEGVWKKFTRRHGDVPATWRDFLTAGWQFRRVESFWALRDIDFEVRQGEIFGIIGANGAGKSTLLNLLGGVGRPSVGRIRVDGRIGALLDLGGGFQRDMSGRENAVMSGIVAGLLKDEVIDRMPEIVEFAGLEEFIDQPVRTYSSGMAVRLAFSVAIHTDPTILLVDEFLSVGDLAFQAKCLDRIRSLCEEGCAIVLISHAMEQIRELCERAMWLRAGRVAALDSAEKITEAFEKEMNAETLRRTPNAQPRILPDGTELRTRENRVGSLEVEITAVRILRREKRKPGDPLEVEIDYFAKKAIRNAIFVLSISREDGSICFDTNSSLTETPVPDLEGFGMARFRTSRLDLGAGSYFVNVGVYEGSWCYAYDSHWHCYPLEIGGMSGLNGFLVSPCTWAFHGEIVQPQD